MAELGNTIVRRVLVDRTRTLQEALDATGCVQDVNPDVMKVTPLCVGEEVDVYFFDYDPELGHLDSQYTAYGLEVDPIAQAKVNEDDPTFADDRPNCCEWGMEENSVMSFSTTTENGERVRRVDVFKYTGPWPPGYRFGGIRRKV